MAAIPPVDFSECGKAVEKKPHRPSLLVASFLLKSFQILALVRKHTSIEVSRLCKLIFELCCSCDGAEKRLCMLHWTLVCHPKWGFDCYYYQLFYNASASISHAATSCFYPPFFTTFLWVLGVLMARAEPERLGFSLIPTWKLIPSLLKPLLEAHRWHTHPDTPEVQVCLNHTSGWSMRSRTARN